MAPRRILVALVLWLAGSDARLFAKPEVPRAVPSAGKQNTIAKPASTSKAAHMPDGKAATPSLQAAQPRPGGKWFGGGKPAALSDVTPERTVVEGLIDMQLMVKAGGAAAALAGAGAAVAWVAPRIRAKWSRWGAAQSGPRFQPPTPKSSPPAADEGPLVGVASARSESEGNPSAPEGACCASSASTTSATSAASGAAATAATTAAAGATTLGTAATVAAANEATLTGMEALLGPMLLRATGTRIEEVAAAEVLRGKVAVLFLSSRAAESELVKHNVTKAPLSGMVATVREACLRSGKGLEVVYVSFDEDARQYRDVLRAFGGGDSSAAANGEANATTGETGASSSSAGAGAKEGWLALPHCDEARRALLLRSLSPGGRANSLPAAIVVNGTTGEVLNRAALAALLGDPEAYPWVAKTPVQLLLGAGGGSAGGGGGSAGSGAAASAAAAAGVPAGGLGSVAGAAAAAAPVVWADGREGTAAEALRGKRYALLYFSAGWCAPCKAFTPLLAAAVDALQARAETAGAEREGTGCPGAPSCGVLLVSHDHDEAGFDAYRKEGGAGGCAAWPALAFGGRQGRQRRAELAASLGIAALPTLAVLDLVTGEVGLHWGGQIFLVGATGVRYRKGGGGGGGRGGGGGCTTMAVVRSLSSGI